MSRFRFVSAGESHGPQLTVIVTGMPAGVRLDRERINRDLARRQHGYGRGGRMKIEHDEAEVVGGVRGGETIGAPVALAIRNRDFENWRGAMAPWSLDDAEAAKRRVHAPRPGHVDLAGGMKYDRRDLRDVLERASARETVSRVAAGAIAKELLRAFGVDIRSGVVSEFHDAIYYADARRYHRNTNRAGGLEGGVTNGQDVVVRAFMKPISTLRRGLPSVDIETRDAHRSQWERSDVTAVPACGVVCEAMLAIVLADAMREKFGGDSLGEMTRNVVSYLEQLQRF